MKKFNKSLIITCILLALFATILALRHNPENTQNPVEYMLNIVENINPSPEAMYNRSTRIVKNNYIDKTYNRQDWEKRCKRYKGKIKTKEDAYVAIESILATLDDPYTRFLNPSDFAEQNRHMDAKLFGIGVYISDFKGNIVIVNVMEETPASKSGLKVGNFF